MKKGAALLDALFLLRPTLFFPVWTYFLAGLHAGVKAAHGGVESVHSLPPLCIAAALSALMGSVFVLNQIEDAVTDRVNRKLFLIANGAVSVRSAYIEATCLAVAAFVAAFWADFGLGLGFLVLFLLAGIFYNYPPTRWKNHPIGGMVVNGIGGMLIYDIGRISGGGTEAFPPAMLAYGLGGVAVFLNTTLPDREGDAATGKVTFGVKYGVGHTAVWAFGFEAAALVVALASREWLLLVPGAAMFPLFVFAAARRTVPDTLRATKWSVLALAASVCVAFPLYLVPILSVFFLSRWYYRKRFGFDYPNFRTS